MKYPIKPAPTEFKNGSFGLPEFVDYLLVSDAEFNTDGEGVRASFRIQKVLEESKDLPYIPLEDSDHARVLRAAEKPTKGYPTPVAGLCYHVLSALADAKGVKPEPEKTEAAAQAPATEPTAN
jgi:hypothetical protein